MSNTRRYLVGLIAVAALAGGCTSAATPTPSPSVTTPTPTPTPSRTYGPNQTAAIEAVTGYYKWWNEARKNPREKGISGLAKYVLGTAIPKITPIPTGDITALLQTNTRQVGDMAIAEIVANSENDTRIPFTVCLDRTATSVVDASGATVDPPDPTSQANLSPAQVFTRRVYNAVVVNEQPDGWKIAEITGGTTSC